MSQKPRLSWLSGLLLALPLAGIVAGLTRGSLSRSFGPGPEAAQPPEKSATPPAGAAIRAGAPGSPELLAGFPTPDGDFSPETLFQRVDGAADALIAAGCRRLLFWRIGDPGAEVELLVFEGAEGAAKVLARDAGPERTAGPGDEASAAEQSVFFRRGRYYVRIVGDPQSGPGGKGLLELAGRMDRAIQASPPDSGEGGTR